MTWSKHSFSSPLHIDRWVEAILAVLAACAGAILLLVLGFLVLEAWPVLNGAGWLRFLDGKGWYPLEGRFGLLPMLWSTIAAGVGAVLIAAPVGLAAACFARFFVPRLAAQSYRLMLALLAGIPSVVYGLWGLTVLVPLIARWHPPGASLLAAILLLGLMIVPTVALTSLAALDAVAPSLLHGAAALGLSRRAIIIGVAVPAASRGIRAGILLASGRALGETMAVLMVAGNVVQNPTGLFEPVRVLTANIALEMGYATGAHRAGLFASGLLLTLLVLALALSGARAAGGRHA